MLLPTFILTILLIAFVFAGMGLRILLIKGGTFRGSCSSNNPYLQNEIGTCQLCGKSGGDVCETDVAKAAPQA